MIHLAILVAVASALGVGEAAADDVAATRTIPAASPSLTAPLPAVRWNGVGCWFWSEEEFAPEGYKRVLNAHAATGAYALLTTSIRHPVEVTDAAVHYQIAAAVHYAKERGIDIALDLDVRLARAAFQAKYPDEMQEILRLQEAPMLGSGELRVRTESVGFGDHYTFKARPYECIAGRLVRVYSYVTGADGIDPESVEDITARCKVEESSTAALSLVIPCGPEDAGRVACSMAAFTVFTPAVFAPHLPEFERAILEQYADIPLAGACKDEWGFPGRFDPTPADLWFSRFMADAYADRRPGRDLVADLLLMSKGMRGRNGERAAAIDHYMEMLRERNVELENNFYAGIKAVFGADAYAGTHPTWFPYPDKREVFKNGLSWWASRRDWAQTDETTPYSARTALAKKWNSPSWLNMYYAPTFEPYADDVWRHALGGGRMNFHQRYPAELSDSSRYMMDADLMVADRRIRMLDYISTAPIDCPVAVLFGHPSALHWAGDGFADTGVTVADALWEKGIYADLIPTSEIASGAVTVSPDGYLTYGSQRYVAAIVYHPQYERPAVGEFLKAVAAGGKTSLFQVGDWTMTFEGEPIDGNAAFPAQHLDAAQCVQAVEQLVHAARIPLQTPCDARNLHGFPQSMVPKRSGVCRLLDGTHIVVSGEDPVKGDAISTLTVNGHEMAVDAIGVAAVRLDASGKIAAVACGGLKQFAGGGLDLALDERLDIALWRTQDGPWQGAVAGLTGAIPEPLAALTSDWQRVREPGPASTK